MKGPFSALALRSAFLKFSFSRFRGQFLILVLRNKFLCIQCHNGIRFLCYLQSNFEFEVNLLLHDIVLMSEA